MSKTTASRDVRYQDYLIESLRDPAEATAYLGAAIECGDSAIYLLALNQLRAAGCDPA